MTISYVAGSSAYDYHAPGELQFVNLPAPTGIATGDIMIICSIRFVDAPNFDWTPMGNVIGGRSQTWAHVVDLSGDPDPYFISNLANAPPAGSISYAAAFAWTDSDGPIDRVPDLSTEFSVLSSYSPSAIPNDVDKDKALYFHINNGATPDGTNLVGYVGEPTWDAGVTQRDAFYNSELTAFGATDDRHMMAAAADAPVSGNALAASSNSNGAGFTSSPYWVRMVWIAVETEFPYWGILGAMT